MVKSPPFQQVTIGRMFRLAGLFLALQAPFSLAQVIPSSTAPGSPLGTTAPQPIYVSPIAPLDTPGTVPAQQTGFPSTSPIEGPDASSQSADGGRSGSSDTTKTATSRTAQTLPVVPSSPVLTEFQRVTESTTGVLLPIFGASLFHDVPSTFAPIEGIPVASDYTLGPGDEIRLQIWGQVNQTSRYTIDRNGNIFVPNVGSLQLAGLPYAKLGDFLRAQFGRVYRNFDLTANLGSLRSISVFVVGNVLRPGSFSVSSLSTLVNALFASGGPLPTGSLRHIQLKRNGAPVHEFDLYDLLQRGDKSQDVVLQPGDVIFVPPAGPMIALSEGVTNPAIYEIKDPITVDQAIQMAGGLLATAGNRIARIERIKDHTLRTVAAVDIVRDGNTVLHDGDIVTFSKVSDQFENAVILRGNVAAPGRYAWHPGMRLRDLIPNKDVLITRDYWKKQNSLAIGATGDYQVPKSTGALTIAPTEVSASSTQASSIAATSTNLSGRFPARNDVILSGADIDWSHADIERLSRQDLTTSLIPFKLGKLVLDGDETQNLELQPGDTITIFSKADIQVPQLQRTRFVRLEGEFVSSGIYSVLPGETLRGLVARAGGFTEGAYLYGSQFTRESTQRIQQERLNEYIDNLDARTAQLSLSNSTRAVNSQDSAVAAASAAEARGVIQQLRRQRASGRIVLEVSPESSQAQQLPDLQLEDGDRFVVPHIPASINVVGAVYDQNSFLYKSSLRLGDYLRMAGGPTRDSDRSRDFVVRADGSVISSQYKSSLRGNRFENVPLYPGDSIVVPQRIDQQATLRNLLDISQIVGQFGLGVAAINVLK